MGITWLWTASVRAARCVPWARAGFWTGGLTLSGGLSLLSVVAVLVVVSVPRLRTLALRENEADARSTAQLLARSLSTLPAGEGRVPTVGECASRPVALADTELLEGGTLLRRHGYLFEVTRLPAPLAPSRSTAPSRLGLRAWPWAHGQTGVVALVVAADGTTWEHANEPRRWDGLAARAEALTDDEGWRADP